MDSQEPASQPFRGSVPRAPEMRALLCADLVDSTALVERLGDIPAAELFRRHDRLARDLVHRHGGQEIDKTDGFLLLFNRALDAVAFALAYQRALRELGAECGQPLRARVGIHLGEVLIWRNAAEDMAQGAKPIEVEGLAKPVAARLMGLALPGQALLSGAAFSLAQRAAGELGDSARSLRWLTHGRYRFKGVPQPQLVHEVGEAGLAPLKPPPSSAKAWRDVPLWRRPAALAVEALAAVLVIGFSLGVLLRPAPVIAFAERDWVVLGDLQNRTGDDAIEGALDTALRIGLEQSRFVNVLPNLQIQDALRRMERPGASVNREIGVELALREGARALLLPTVSEVGKRLRLSVELVDPASAATVYVFAVEATDREDLLPKADSVLVDLRSSLGESIKDIGQSSAPLIEITTKNLDALRAFGLAERALSERKVDEGLMLLRMATELDPDFAMAHARIGSVLVTHRRDFSGGFSALDHALSLSARLSLRERSIITAVREHYSYSLVTLGRWSALARLYPDISGARHNLGIVLAFWRNEPEQALEHFDFVASSGNPRRAESMLAAAHALLLLGELGRAKERIDQARPLLQGSPLHQEALVYLASREYSELESRLGPLDGVQVESAPVERLLLRAGLMVDRRQLAQARDLLDSAIRARGRRGWTPSMAVLEISRSAIKSALGESDAAALDRLVEEERSRLGGTAAEGDRSAELHLALVLPLLLREGRHALVAEVIAQLEPRMRDHGQRAIEAHVRTVSCMLLAPEERLSCLDAIPVPTYHVTLAAAVDAARLGSDENELARRKATLERARHLAVGEGPFLEWLVPNLLDSARLLATPSP